MYIVKKLITSFKGDLLNIPTPICLSYWWSFGVMLGFVYVVQVVRGVILTIFFWCGRDGSFIAVNMLMRDIVGGWLMRIVHSSGVTIFFILIYLHIVRGLFYGGYKNVSVWNSGVFILVLTMGVAFLGYVLP